MDFQKEQTELAVQAADMAESACRVKGPLFADVVNSLYALHGMRDLSHRLIDAVREGVPYIKTIEMLHGNVQNQLLSALPEADRAEAATLALHLIGNQTRMHKRIERSA